MKAKPDGVADYARVIVDTNVFLSAALAPHGIPAELIDWLLSDSRLVFSQETFAELETRLWKPKFDRYLSIEHRTRLLRELNACALWFEIPPAISQQSFSRDSNDDMFVQLAITAKVNRLISGDDDLLCLNPLGALQILSPRCAFDEITLKTGR